MKSYCWGCVHSIISRIRKSSTDFPSVYYIYSSSKKGKRASYVTGALGPGAKMVKCYRRVAFVVATPASRGMVACSRMRCGLQKSDVNTTCLLVRRRRIS